MNAILYGQKDRIVYRQNGAAGMMPVKPGHLTLPAEAQGSTT